MARTPIARRVVALVGLATLLAETYAAAQQLPARRVKSGTAPPACATQAGVLALNFAHEFAGVSQTDHESDVWTGRVGGARSGDLVMTLQLLGSPMEAANPVWKVRTRWTLTPDSDAALAAELYGTVNWKTGIMRLSGAVTEGCLAGSEVHVNGRFVDMNGSGTIQILPATALSQADQSGRNP